MPGKRDRQSVDAAGIRVLNAPGKIAVEADERGLPRAVTLWRRLRVAEIQDIWRIDDEWWRDVPAPGGISRRYFLIALEDGSLRVIYQDLIGGGWFEQRY